MSVFKSVISKWSKKEEMNKQNNTNEFEEVSTTYQIKPRNEGQQSNLNDEAIDGSKSVLDQLKKEQELAEQNLKKLNRGMSAASKHPEDDDMLSNFYKFDEQNEGEEEIVEVVTGNANEPNEIESAIYNERHISIDEVYLTNPAVMVRGSVEEIPFEFTPKRKPMQSTFVEEVNSKNDSTIEQNKNRFEMDFTGDHEVIKDVPLNSANDIQFVFNDIEGEIINLEEYMTEDEGKPVTYIQLTFHNRTTQKIMVAGESSRIADEFSVSMTINKQVTYYNLYTNSEVVIKQSELADFKITN